MTTYTIFAKSSFRHVPVLSYKGRGWGTDRVWSDNSALEDEFFDSLEEAKSICANWQNTFCDFTELCVEEHIFDEETEEYTDSIVYSIKGTDLSYMDDKN